MDLGVLGSRGSSWTSHEDHSLLLPLATLDLFVLNFICVELCCSAYLCLMSCMNVEICGLGL